ncbi:uracil-DNA glycosylase [Prevotella pallens]|jgi:uracil-DNA glycosylase|nr:uracil-DNA glycosylase [Prevotella pallens]MBF1451508.1 uracil-DNA glycosylase [Prevotella pallens]MBF1472981.1 uracil-DNA glycosylase [Prevotella pallens]MBF1474274.1 uracil-DNA glycosylase [Prevotella pallens]MBF1488071.1 uracil-DNA glycosylase [Prevotella pallens]MBF1517992.1 uracil-DNA glycosylase [Prevotella pallens]
MIDIEASWKQYLKSEFEKPYFAKLTENVRNEYKNGLCFPPAKLVFNAFNLCPFNKVKVVILGQDPYHELGQAMGLSFSVPDGIMLPPSLQNIYKEIHSDLGKPIPTSGDLTRWAKQGVLLLNATLTVRAHEANSHQALGWQNFTDAAIETINTHREHIVFMLWGGFARSKKRLIDTNRHCIIESVHPSPLSANRGGWFGQHQFSRCNAYLKQYGLGEIDW